VVVASYIAGELRSARMKPKPLLLLVTLRKADCFSRS
jgi:hypothetical protein